MQNTLSQGLKLNQTEPVQEPEPLKYLEPVPKPESWYKK